MRGLTYNQNEIGEIIKDTPTDSNNSGACVKASISSSGMTERDIVCPYCNGAGHLNANSGSRQFQMALLRQELIKAYMENDAMEKSYQETIRIMKEEAEQLTISLDEKIQTINEL